MIYDVIIVGMGISGISSAIYAKQAGLNVLMFESKIPGGLLNQIDEVSNYAGIGKIKGSDFAMNLFNQVNDLKIDYQLSEIEKIEDGEVKSVYTKDKIYKCKNVILAIGRSPKLLGLDNEKKILGKGISTCAVCDGYFYKENDVAVIGNGNSALQECIYLSNIVKKVYLLIRKDKLTGMDDLIEKVKSKENIEINYQTNIEKINEENGKLKNLVLSTGKILNVAGLFVYAGYAPDTKFLNNLNITNKNGYIEIDENLETKIKGIFAIGDVTIKEVYQLITAAGDGAKVVKKLHIN